MKKTFDITIQNVNFLTVMDERIQLSRRERQIMDILYAQDEATVTEVLENIPDAPTRTSIRTIMRILEGKGHLKHKQQGREYVYYPSKPLSQVAPPALQRVLQTFFGGSLEKAVAMHLADHNTEISKAELRRLANIVNEARRKEPGNE